MRKHQLEELLREAIVLDAEEQGERLEREPQAEPIPEKAQARFDAALYGKRKTEKAMHRRTVVRRAVGYSLAGVGAVAAIFAVLLVFGLPNVSKGGLPGAPSIPVDQPEEPGNPAEPTKPEMPWYSGDVRFYLNGELQNVYTGHYVIKETEDSIPLNAFLGSIGSYDVDSPYNRYQVQCSEIQGIRYIYDWESKVFALAQQYDVVVQTLKALDKTPTAADFESINLLPAETEMQAETWLDHRTLEQTLRKLGLDITIEIDRDAEAIFVTMPEPETIVIPDDPERPDLQLHAHPWQGLTCLLPKSFKIIYAEDRGLDAYDDALLQWDEEALESIELLTISYCRLYPEEMDGKDPLQWYLMPELAEEGISVLEKPEDFGQAVRTEITEDVVCLHYRHRDTEGTRTYWFCFCYFDGMFDNGEGLMVFSESYSETGNADFDSIVRRFVRLNSASHAPDMVETPELGHK